MAQGSISAANSEKVPNAQRKRKDGPFDAGSSNNQAQKKVKFERSAVSKNARTIASQASFNAFGHGMLDVDKFVKAREYEIRALEQGLVNSKKALSKRAFQLVPKDLRRRTASHNAKRVPKRLRDRAKREMKDDNTPTVTARRRKLSSQMRLRTETAKKLRALGSGRKVSKASDAQKPTNDNPIKARHAKVKQARLAEVPLPKAKFRKRQRDKTWLPTHLFHSKRARMTPPKEPLWRFALPLTPTAKSYRPTHRAANDRGTVAFDMSYIATIQLSGRYTSLLAALRALDADGSVDKLRASRRRAWMRGQIVFDLDIYYRDSPSVLIAPITTIWCPLESFALSTSAEDIDKLESSLFLRVHPSAFLELWEELLRVRKTVKPAITVEDLRYELGCIEMIGPASTGALLAALRPCRQEDEAVLSQIAGVTNTALLPSGTVVDMEMQDPRLCRTSRGITNNKTPPATQSLAGWTMPITSRTGALFDRPRRKLASQRMPSQKAVNRRRSDAPLNKDPAALDHDPRIPVLMYTTASTSKHLPLNKWTVLLPWKCVLPVWYALVYLPLSTGLQPRFGGVTELRDLSLEHGLPWFPGDFPATQAGWHWEQQERQRLKAEWKSRPKSKRLDWQKLDLGNGNKGEVGEGWSCDWARLQPSSKSLGLEPGQTDQNTVITEQQTSTRPDLQHISAGALSQQVEAVTSKVNHRLLQIRIEHITRGVSQPCARIYRLPTDPERRKAWLSIHPKYQEKSKAAKRSLPKTSKNASAQLVQKQLAQSLLEIPQAGQPDWPSCPDEDDLIGFVTAGNYDLGAGRGTAIGSILAVAELEARATSSESSDVARLCIVRNSGQSTGRLARWHVI